MTLDLIARLESASEGSRALSRVTVKPSLLDRAVALVTGHDGSDVCILWPGKVDAQGRGRVLADGKLMLSHRAVWERIRGPIPADMMLCHHCDNPTCINPSHIYVGTHADNTRDAVERKRYFWFRDPERVREIGRQLGQSNNWSAGERNPKAKLSVAHVTEIAESTEKTRFLAARYGVKRTTIQRIRSGKLWKSARMGETR